MIQTVRGTFDVLPSEIPRWRLLEETARAVFRCYGYREIRTPIFERTELFARSVGEETDIVAKEMYTFTDRSGESLSLRPESTASVVRAYIQHKMWTWGSLVKLFYLGPHFRYERPQKGRFRQFHQIGAEAIGQTDDPAIDAELIEMVEEYLDRLGIVERALFINSVGCSRCRPAYVRHLKEALAGAIARMCENCQRRYETNPLRILDCKVEEDQSFIERAPALLDHLCAECAAHFEALRRHLEARGIAYQIASRLVRGLDYYTRTAFEITSARLGAQNAVAGGGRYDGLSELLGGPPAKGIGFALGVERLLLALPEKAAVADDAPDLYIAYLGEAARQEAFRVARRLRRAGLVVIYDFEERKLRRLMAQADRVKARYALLIGEDELAAGRYTLRDLQTGEQEALSEEALVQKLSTSRKSSASACR
ncbi:MAG: histidine--tRNA ligase [Blastocatellia bacterium]|nr:histidine--tRNA ligase [Blastocatellia bacterium]MCS7158311.1 histidine--tRNA ligase [Blastocatellia bacterium]MCX7753149.1 histidine--tRNA ligase [Blastocatellia bacterium]MDW8169464.1 histidine--tRNA ligase [Acidobacteriota bacterium]MDW8255738.1 histidine--tRNA ligase [Acidobacteriota bacterium]